MANPDVTGYVDLRVFDKDSQDIIDAALLDMLTKVPDWKPREGNIEMLLLEAVALEVSEAIVAINRLPSATAEILFRLFGIDRFTGTQPTTTITFNLADTQGHDIPAGTRVLLELSDGLDPIIFTTDTGLAIPVTLTSGTVTATGDRFTSDGNGTPAGTSVDILDSIAFVNTAVLGSIVTDGVNEEDDETWFTRALNRFSRLTETLVSPLQFIAAALEHVECERAFAIDQYDPAVGPIGGNPGHVTVAVYGHHVMLSQAFKDALDSEFESAAQANLSIHVINPVVTTVNVNVTVIKNILYTDTSVINSTTATIRSYLDSLNWDFSNIVRVNSLIGVIGSDITVAYVGNVITPASDVFLSGDAPLTTPGAVTINIANPGGGSL